MGIYALTTLAKAVDGAPICEGFSENNRIEIALKGGQMGGIDYFDLVARGGKFNV